MKQIDKERRDRYLAQLRLIKEGAVLNPFESKEDQQQRILRAQKSIEFCVAYYFAHYATSKSARFQLKLAVLVAKNPIIRALVRWPRAHAKSVWCNIIIPIWLWIRGEDLFVLLVGNTKDSAEDLLADLQAEFEANSRLAHDFGEQQLRGSWEKGNFSTRDGRFRGKAMGMRQSVRGLRKGARRPNYISCDDLEDQETEKNPRRQDAIIKWIENDLLKTMDGPVRRYLHPNNDPYERSIQNELERRHPNWHLDLVKAYDKKTYKPAWPQKYTPQYFKDQEKDGILSAHAEFLHEPLIEGKVFTKEMIQWAKAPKPGQFKILVGHWDVAYSGKNDYNAVKVWGLHGVNFWHIKGFCRQCEMEDAIRWMYEYEKLLPEGVIIQWRVEKQFWNKPVIQAIETVRKERKRWLNISVVDRPTTNKFSRIMSMHPYYQFGRIYYDKREYANNDMLTGLKQLYGIEPGYKTHDDGPDADQQAIDYLAEFVEYGSAATDGDIQMGGSRRNHK